MSERGIATREQTAACRLQFTWFGVTRAAEHDAVAETATALAADESRLSLRKRVLDRAHPAYRRLTTLRTQTRATWIAATLPYVEPGIRLVPRQAIAQLDVQIEELGGGIARATDALDDVRDELIEDARGRLGRLFVESDYPATFRGLFGVSIDYPSVEPPDYLMRLNPDLYRREQERVREQFAAAAHAAEQAFIAEMSAMINHLRDRLAGDAAGGKPRVFRDTAVENVKAFFERFNRLSFESSDELDNLVTDAERLLDGVEPDALRASADLRQHVAGELAKIEGCLEGLTIAKPTRIIRRQAA